jgi:hypothetical protein
VLAGLALAVEATRLFGSLLYEVSPHDPYVLAGTAATVSLIALAPACVPARRAAPRVSTRRSRRGRNRTAGRPAGSGSPICDR